MDDDTLREIGARIAVRIDKTLPKSLGYALIVISESSCVATGAMHGNSLEKPALRALFRAATISLGSSPSEHDN